MSSSNEQKVLVPENLNDLSVPKPSVPPPSIASLQQLDRPIVIFSGK